MRSHSVRKRSRCEDTHPEWGRSTPQGLVGQRGVGLRQQVPAGLRELPPAQVGELGPGPLLSAACRERLEDGVLDALSTTAGEERE